MTSEDGRSGTAKGRGGPISNGHGATSGHANGLGSGHLRGPMPGGGGDLRNHRNHRSHRRRSLASVLLRTALLDLPTALSLILLMGSLAARSVYSTYYVPLMQHLLWINDGTDGGDGSLAARASSSASSASFSSSASKGRHRTEGTYYRRTCDARDVTSTSAGALIVPPGEDAPRAAHRTQTHGMAVFPGVVSDEHATALRDYILHRNSLLRPTDVDFIGLISNQHRWSFKLGADPPAVAPVLRDLATHPVLRPTLDVLLGSHSSLVELTAITSAYGAGDQHYHQDNSLDSCQMDNARSFASMYSIFVPLQDTTAAMGATDACVGTHYCYDPDGQLAHSVCGGGDDGEDGLAFRLVGTRDGAAAATATATSTSTSFSSSNATADPTDIDPPPPLPDRPGPWRAGDAMIFDMPVVHRGPAHTDPHAPPRVMLILTLSPRPRGPGVDRRQLGLGTSFSNRWDMWGLSLPDLEDAAEAMRQPWRTLRTLGLHKRPSEGEWGWDLPTVTASRIVNFQFGYRDEEMEGWVEQVRGEGEGGGFSAVLGYVLGHHQEEGWRTWVEVALDRTVHVAAGLCAGMVGTALLLSGIGGALVGLRGRDRGEGSGPGPGARSAMRRYLLHQTLPLGAAIGTLALLGLVHLSRTPWGSDLIRGRHLDPPFVDVALLEPEARDRSWGPTVLPVRDDVLLGTRLHSPWLASHNRMLDYHPGNARWIEVVGNLSGPYRSYRGLPAAFREGLARAVLGGGGGGTAPGGGEGAGGRVLLQNAEGDWVVLSDLDGMRRARRALRADREPGLAAAGRAAMEMASECRHGRRRLTAMYRRHCAQLPDVIVRRIHGEREGEEEEEVKMENMEGDKLGKGALARASSLAVGKGAFAHASSLAVGEDALVYASSWAGATATTPPPSAASRPRPETTAARLLRRAGLPAARSDGGGGGTPRRYGPGDAVVAYLADPRRPHDGHWLGGVVITSHGRGSHDVRLVGGGLVRAHPSRLLRSISRGGGALSEGEAWVAQGGLVYRVARVSARFECLIVAQDRALERNVPCEELLPPEEEGGSYEDGGYEREIGGDPGLTLPVTELVDKLHDAGWDPREGDPVEARWADDVNEWYKGSVAEVDPSDGTYSVTFDDGDDTSGLHRNAVRRYFPLRQDEIVEAKVIDGDDDVWMLASVSEVHGHGVGTVVEVATSDGFQATLPLTHVRRLDWAYAEGSRVMAHWEDDGEFKAFVSRVNADGTYDVTFEDGDFLPDVQREDLRFRWT